MELAFYLLDPKEAPQITARDPLARKIGATFLIAQTLFLVLMLNSMLVKDTPFKQSPISPSLRKDWFLWMLLQIALPFCQKIVKIEELAIPVTFAALLTFETRRQKLPAYLKSKMMAFEAIVDSFLMWATLSTAISLVVTKDSYISLYVVLGYPLSVIGLLRFRYKHQMKAIEKGIYARNKKWDRNLKTFVIEFSKLFILLEEDDMVLVKARLLTSLRKGIVDMAEISSPFLYGVKRLTDKLLKVDKNSIPRMSEDSYLLSEPRELEEKMIKNCWVQLYQHLIDYCCSTYHKDYNFLLLRVYFYLEFDPRRYMIMSRTQELHQKPLNLNEQYQRFTITRKIEGMMKAAANEERNKLLKTAIDYEILNTNFRSSIFRFARLKKFYWMELIAESGKIKNLLRLKDLIHEAKVRTHHCYRQMVKISPTNIKTMEYYTACLTILEGDFETAKSVNRRLLKILQKASFSRRRLLKSEIDTKAIILISGRPDSLGRILELNKHAAELLEESHNRVIGNPIEAYMPNFYARHHRKFIQKFYKTGETKLLGNNRKIFALSKNNFLRECELHVSMMPTLGQGIKFIGVLSHQNEADELLKLADPSKIRREFVLCYEENSGQIIHACENSFRYLGLDTNLDMNSNLYKRLNMKEICPDVYNPEIESELRQKGTELTFDTSNLYMETNYEMDLSDRLVIQKDQQRSNDTVNNDFSGNGLISKNSMSDRDLEGLSIGMLNISPEEKRKVFKTPGIAGQLFKATSLNKNLKQGLNTLFNRAQQSMYGQRRFVGRIIIEEEFDSKFGAQSTFGMHSDSFKFLKLKEPRPTKPQVDDGVKNYKGLKQVNRIFKSKNDKKGIEMAKLKKRRRRILAQKISREYKRDKQGT